MFVPLDKVFPPLLRIRPYSRVQFELRLASLGLGACNRKPPVQGVYRRFRRTVVTTRTSQARIRSYISGEENFNKLFYVYLNFTTLTFYGICIFKL